MTATIEQTVETEYRDMVIKSVQGKVEPKPAEVERLLVLTGRSVAAYREDQATVANRLMIPVMQKEAEHFAAEVDKLNKRCAQAGAKAKKLKEDMPRLILEADQEVQDLYVQRANAAHERSAILTQVRSIIEETAEGESTGEVPTNLCDGMRWSDPKRKEVT